MPLSWGWLSRGKSLERFELNLCGMLQRIGASQRLKLPSTGQTHMAKVCILKSGTEKCTFWSWVDFEQCNQNLEYQLYCFKLKKSSRVRWVNIFKALWVWPSVKRWSSAASPLSSLLASGSWTAGTHAEDTGSWKSLSRDSIRPQPPPLVVTGTSSAWGSF